jgi:hypothetical protein
VFSDAPMLAGKLKPSADSNYFSLASNGVLLLLFSVAVEVHSSAFDGLITFVFVYKDADSPTSINR